MIEQPIGTMFMGSMSAEDAYNISRSKKRSSYGDGIQREIIPSRVQSIAKYCEDPDAVFPTPIILSGDSAWVNINFEKNEITFDEIKIQEGDLFSVVDGQHRLEGIKKSRRGKDFTLPVIIIFDTNTEQDAYLFSIINGNQRPVSSSLVYDLFDLSDKRTIEKTCNSIVKSLNTEEESPLYKKIKMLGIKSIDTPDAKISQATIIRNLIPYISKDPKKDNLSLKLGDELEKLDSQKYIFRDLFIQEEDFKIYQILNNYLKAFKIAIDENFDNPTSEFFDKTVGTTSKILFIKPLYLKSLKQNDFKTSFYLKELYKLIQSYKKEFDTRITSDEYGSSDSAAKKLTYRFIRSWCKVDKRNLLYCTMTELLNAFFVKELKTILTELEELQTNGELKMFKKEFYHLKKEFDKILNK